MNGQNSNSTKGIALVVVGIVVAVAALIGLFVLKSAKNKVEVQDGKVSATNNPNTAAPTKMITLSEISTHSSKESCWTTINGGVYDVTKFIPQHKGGERILAACGVDATDLFTGKSPMGRLHSQVAVKFLSSMKIGELQK